MKTVEIGNKEYIFIQIPDDAYNFSLHRYFISADKEGLDLPVDWFSNTFINYNFEKDYKIITTTNTITEEIAKSVVEKHVNIFYRNYNVNIDDLFTKGWAINWDKITALESFYSLMDSLELDRSKNYLLIEKLCDLK